MVGTLGRTGESPRAFGCHRIRPRRCLTTNELAASSEIAERPGFFARDLAFELVKSPVIAYPVTDLGVPIPMVTRP